MKKLLLIDGMAAVYRAYFAMGEAARVNSKGMNTGTILGFTTTLYNQLRSLHPTHAGVAFDLPAPTFRHEMYPEYKANREAMPEEIQDSLPWVRRMIEAFRIPILTCEGYEADDVIGTLSHQAEAAGFDEVVMATPDKDFAQLVTPHIHLLRLGRAGYADTLMGEAEVREKYDVAECRQVIDLLGLWGDAVDNIPGIRGIGEKTAKKLIGQFGSIEEMVAHSADIKNDRIRRLVEEGTEAALFSKQLATICLSAPIGFDEEALRVEKPDYDTLHDLCNELEFRQFSRRLFTDLSVSDPSEAIRWQQSGSPAAKPAKPTEPTLFGPEPTLFDNTPSPTDAPAVTLQEVQPADLAAYTGCDIALTIEEGMLYLSTDADTVCRVAFGAVSPDDLTLLFGNRQLSLLCFDLKALLHTLDKKGGAIGRHTVDLQLAHYLADAETRHTLDFVCSALLGYEPQDAAARCAALWQLYPLLASRLTDAGLEPLYHDVEMPLVEVLHDMEREGVRIDTAALTDYARRLSAERQEIEQEIYRLAGTTFNIGSPRQLGEVLYERLQVTDKPPRTATKQYSTAEEVLAKLAAKHPIIPLILEYRSLAKLVGTYLGTFPRLISPATGRLHTVYNQTVTATGRLSSSNPNLQNIPIRTERGREIRRAFVPRNDDYLLLAADYSQIELRIIASLAHDRHMLADFNSGFDIHAATAAKIYHLPIGEVSKEQRRNAKSVNFGIVYGISAFGLSEQLGIPRAEAKALIDEYFEQYPDIRRFIDSSIEFARQNGYARTLMGRRRYLPDINSRNASARNFAERNAVNMPIQGTSADMIKLAMVRIHRRIKELGLRSRMILQVHDELVFDLYRPEEAQMRTLVEQEMKQALPLEGLDIDVGIDVGNNWLEAH